MRDHAGTDRTHANLTAQWTENTFEWLDPGGLELGNNPAVLGLPVKGVKTLGVSQCTHDWVRVRAYVLAVDARSANCLAGASASKATPMITSAATPIRRCVPSLAVCNACTTMTAA
jgi:hypothetical protein